jgi:hypothetical protein
MGNYLIEIITGNNKTEFILNKKYLNGFFFQLVFFSKNNKQKEDK